MPIGGPLAQIVSGDLNQTGRARASHNPMLDYFAKVLGKDRDDIETQHASLKRAEARASYQTAV
jgi:hypothetical protein